MTAALISLFVLGLTGSLHCAGMCGPIVVALSGTGGKMKSMLLYHAGRATTYALLGFVFGMIGQQVNLIPFQRGSSIAIGVILIIALIIQLTRLRTTLHWSPAFMKKIGKNLLGKAMRSRRSLFIIGMANGILPCGLVYLALMTAIATQNALTGALGMFVFGIATSPILMLFQSSEKFIQTRPILRKTFPILVAVVSVLVVLRGLGLDIPLISPDFEGGGCCEKH